MTGSPATHRTMVLVDVAGFTRHHEDRGDGVMILVPAEIPAIMPADQLLERIVAALREHNAVHSHEASIQSRVALRSGQVSFDGAGAPGRR